MNFGVSAMSNSVTTSLGSGPVASGYFHMIVKGKKKEHRVAWAAEDSVRQAVDRHWKKLEQNAFDWTKVILKEKNSTVEFSATEKASTLNLKTLTISESKNPNKLHEEGEFEEYDDDHRSAQAAARTETSTERTLKELQQKMAKMGAATAAAAPATGGGGNFHLEMKDVHAPNANIGNQLGAGAVLQHVPLNLPPMQVKETVAFADDQDNIPVAELDDPACDEGLVLEHGMNTTLDVQFLDRLRSISKSVFRTVRSKGNNKVALGTASLILADSTTNVCLVITNHHVFPDAATATNAKVQVDYENDEDKKKNVRLAPQIFFVTSKIYDCTIVACDPSEAKKVGLTKRKVLPLKFGTSQLLTTDSRVFLVHHPHGLPKQISIQGGLVATVGHYLQYTADTQKGSSGAAVLNSSLEFTGLHHKGIPKKVDNKYVNFKGKEWKKGDPPEQQQHIANQGILVDYLLEWLLTGVAVTSSVAKDQAQLTILVQLLMQDTSEKMLQQLVPLNEKLAKLNQKPPAVDSGEEEDEIPKPVAKKKPAGAKPAAAKPAAAHHTPVPAKSAKGKAVDTKQNDSEPELSASDDDDDDDDEPRPPVAKKKPAGAKPAAAPAKSAQGRGKAVGTKQDDSEPDSSDDDDEPKPASKGKKAHRKR